MKKILNFLAVLMMTSNIAMAEMGINLGLSLSAGAFSVDGAKEQFKGAHSSGASVGDVTKNASSDGDEAEGLFAIGSVFVEKTLTDKISIGINYVPHALESETTENTQTTTTSSATGTNRVQVDFENLATVYAMLGLSDNVYVKAGYTEVDVKTNEVLATGSSYGDTKLDGYTLALGYNRELSNGAFFRAEGMYMELDGATLVSTADTTKSVTADGITGYGATISIGKSF